MIYSMYSEAMPTTIVKTQTREISWPQMFKSKKYMKTTFALFLCPKYLPLNATNTSINLRLSGLGNTKYTTMKFYNPNWNQTLNSTSDIDYICWKGRVWTSEITANGCFGSQKAESILYFLIRK